MSAGALALTFLCPLQNGILAELSNIVVYEVFIEPVQDVSLGFVFAAEGTFVCKKVVQFFAECTFENRSIFTR